MSQMQCPIEQFQLSQSSDWENWIERIELWFMTQEMDNDNKKKATVLTHLAPEAYKLVKNLLHPKKPSEATYGEITAKLTDHLMPASNPIIERYKFYSRYRKDGETVADFVADLRQIARKCDFNDKLEENLRDRIVCGINNQAVQKRLLAIGATLTYKTSIETALAMEVAAAQSASMRGGGEASQVDRVELSRVEMKKSDNELKCFRCGGNSHLANRCRFKNAD